MDDILPVVIVGIAVLVVLNYAANNAIDTGAQACYAKPEAKNMNFDVRTCPEYANAVQRWGWFPKSNSIIPFFNIPL